MRGSKPVTKGISRLAANYITYEDTAFPFSGLLVEERAGQKCLDSPRMFCFPIWESGWVGAGFWKGTRIC